MNTERLLRILGLRRKHNSPGEQKMIQEELLCYDNCLSFTHPTTKDTLAYVISVGDSTTLFTAHTDTIVRSHEQLVYNDYFYNKLTETIHAKDGPLGADDGAGVWLLLEMIDANVPGVYLFPRGEECGGIGSSGIAKHYYDWLRQFDRCVSFDRKSVHSVITHQGGLRCCSDDFALALSDALSDDTYFFAPDTGGVFTDSKNFVDDIPECTNVSIGYMNEHSDKESLDLSYLYNLRDKCLLVDWSALPTVRDPRDVEYLGGYGYAAFGGYGSGIIDDDFSAWTGGKTIASIHDGGKQTVYDKMQPAQLVDLAANMDYYSLVDAVADMDAYTVADLVSELLLYYPMELCDE